MSEILMRKDVSTESICTVIENSNSSENTNSEQSQQTLLNGSTTTRITNSNTQPNTEIEQVSYEIDDELDAGFLSEGSNVNNKIKTAQDCDRRASDVTSNKTTRGKLKKSVSFDPNDEKVRKFIDGEPIVDQRNPFKNGFASSHNGKLKKKTPPPVPTKRSTLSIRKTVTQQLREREREKERERERLKNETNNRKSNGNLHSPEEFVTTEEVLKQSKYVKTYIKNPDPYFVYDPSILARLKFEELRELSAKKPPKKLKLSGQTRERLKDLKNKQAANELAKTRIANYKKCSKPNYPELSDIKIKVGTEPDGNYFNPAEVTKNAKKFDERVKKLHISSDDDLDELDCPLTKSESSDEVAAGSNSSNSNLKANQENIEANTNMNAAAAEQQQMVDGSFTSTIKSKEFQEYLEKKGLTLIPKKIPNGAQSMYAANGALRSNANRSAQSTLKPITANSVDVMDSPSKNGNKKPSVFQRLLSNSIFASKRRTTPKEIVPTPRKIYDASTADNRASTQLNGGVKTPAPIKRVVLERQSYHGRSRNTAAESNERLRKTYSNDDNLSISISSALTNAEYANEPVVLPQRKSDAGLAPKPLAKPPRRALSKDRLHSATDGIVKPKAQLATMINNDLYSPSITQTTASTQPFRRTLERQSLIPKRTAAISDGHDVFARSASMPRNEILKRSANRGVVNANAVIITAKQPLTEETIVVEVESPLKGTPTHTSTPIKTAAKNAQAVLMSPMLIKPTQQMPVINGGTYVDAQEWARLKAIKEQTDREFYYKVHQQQQLQQQQKQTQALRLATENAYELPPQQAAYLAQRQLLQDGNFIRGSPQRNTFSGVIRNRQATIIDGKAHLVPEQQQQNAGQPARIEAKVETVLPTTRSQSVLDNMTQSKRNGTRREYESDTETAVVLRKKSDAAETRRIGGLTREEILQRVKEFCRKSLNKTPTLQQQQPQLQVVYEKQALNSKVDLSPVSYASVETQQRPISRLYAAPQVPQRMQSLAQQQQQQRHQQQFVPISQELLPASSSSPIYAHVVKRSSLQSNQSELYDSPQQHQQQQQQEPRPYLLRRDSELQPLYLSRGTLPQFVTAPTPTQYILVDSNEKLAPTSLLAYPPAELYMQPQYVRPQQLQPLQHAAPYGYIAVKEPMAIPMTAYRPTRLLDGRSTPLILDRSSQQASQIYWTPQHQRLQQQAALLPVHISPRYALKQTSSTIYPVPAPRTDINGHSSRVQLNIPANHQQQQQQQYSPMSRMEQPLKRVQNPIVPGNLYDWESGSEAGEVQRIMEQPRNSELSYSIKNG